MKNQSKNNQSAGKRGQPSRNWCKCCIWLVETVAGIYWTNHCAKWSKPIKSQVTLDSWEKDYIQTWFISRKSWLTRTIPPSKSLIASAKASMVSISKWLVGSSSNRRCGAWKASQAKTTRHRCPSDKLRMGQICVWLETNYWSASIFFQ